MSKETHSLRSFLFLCSLFGGVLLHNQACQETSSSAYTDTQEAQLLLQQLSSEVLLPELHHIREELTLLHDLLTQYQQDPSVPHKEMAQESWKRVMHTWQKIELMQFGPMANSLQSIAGEDLRDEIYSWPTTNPCRIDQKTATEEFLSPDYFSNNLVNAYGLDALEHLLFAEPDTVCPAQISPVSDGLWDSLGSETITNNRVSFALLLTNDVQQSIDELIARWEPNQENFTHTFVQGMSPYSSSQEPLLDVFQSLFYMETYTKEKKLAQPLGIHDCSSITCIESLEGAISQRSLDSIIANIEGFSLVFTGGEGYGFDDLLQDKGHDVLSQKMLDAIDTALEKANSLQYPLERGILEEKEAVMELYTAIDSISSILKQEISLILSLSVPAEASGDND